MSLFADRREKVVTLGGLLLCLGTATLAFTLGKTQAPEEARHFGEPAPSPNLAPNGADTPSEMATIEIPAPGTVPTASPEEPMGSDASPRAALETLPPAPALDLPSSAPPTQASAAPEEIQTSDGIPPTLATSKTPTPPTQAPSVLSELSPRTPKTKPVPTIQRSRKEAQMRTQGTFRVRARISADGRIEKVEHLEGLPRKLYAAAANAMREWRFPPTLRDGKAVAVVAEFEAPFRTGSVPSGSLPSDPQIRRPEVEIAGPDAAQSLSPNNGWKKVSGFTVVGVAKQTSETRETDGPRADGCLRLFLTPELYSGDLRSQGEDERGLSVANALCQQAAEEADLEGNWVAWLSDSQSHAWERIPAEGPWCWVGAPLGATPAFSDRNKLRQGPNRPIARGPRGEKLSGFVWTGTEAEGKASSDTCKDWSTSQATGTVGNPELPGQWTEAGIQPCHQRLALFCLETQSR